MKTKKLTALLVLVTVVALIFTTCDLLSGDEKDKDNTSKVDTTTIPAESGLRGSAWKQTGDTGTITFTADGKTFTKASWGQSSANGTFTVESCEETTHPDPSVTAVPVWKVTFTPISYNSTVHYFWKDGNNLKYSSVNASTGNLAAPFTLAKTN